MTDDRRLAAKIGESEGKNFSIFCERSFCLEMASVNRSGATSFLPDWIDYTNCSMTVILGLLVHIHDSDMNGC